jgi:hypothetical protein
MRSFRSTLNLSFALILNCFETEMHSKAVAKNSSAAIGSVPTGPKKLPPLEPVVMSIEAKAHTLGYELPSAESEIRRLEDVQRSLRDEFLGKRRNCAGRGAQDRQSNLAGWLDRHPDTTLGDLDLASSPLPIKAVSLPAGVPMGTVKGDTDIDVDPLGLGRYGMRGDLKAWLDHVAELASTLKLDAGDWSAKDEKELDKALLEATRMVVSKDDERNAFLCREHITTLLEMLSAIGSRRFYVDVRTLPTHEALDGLVVQVREWYSQFLKFGHAGRPIRKEEDESSKAVETEDDIRKRQLAGGIAAAAHSQHILLTQAQLDQVLAAFYNQSHIVSKREKGRIERKLVESLTREDNLTANLKRANKVLSEKVSSLQEVLDRHLNAEKNGKGGVDATANALSELRRPAAVENMNQMTQAMAEVLSKKRIREAEAKVASLTEAYNELKVHHEQNVSLVVRMQKENADLVAAVDEIQRLWESQMLAKAQQEEERRRMYGGLQSDQQFYQASLTALMNASLSTISTLLTNATVQSEKHAATVRLLTADQLRLLELESDVSGAASGGLEEAKSLVFAWTTAVYNTAVTEGARVALQKLTSLVVQQEDGNKGADQNSLEVNGGSITVVRKPGSDRVEDAQSSAYRSAKAHLRKMLHAPPQDKGTALAKAFSAVGREYSDPDRELVGAVAQRLDTAISEAKTKFRELRYMRSVLWWLVGAVEALVNGTYTDAQHGLLVQQSAVKKKGPRDRAAAAPGGGGKESSETHREVNFPPASVVALDSDYGYAWVDECKSLERIFMSLRSLLGSSTDKSNINNVLLTAIESTVDQSAVLRSRRQTALVPGTSLSSSGANVDSAAERSHITQEVLRVTAESESLIDLRLSNALESGRDGVTMGRQSLLTIQAMQQEQLKHKQEFPPTGGGAVARESVHTMVEAMYHAVQGQQH